MQPAALPLPPLNFAAVCRRSLLAVVCLASGATVARAQQASPAPLAEDASLRQMMTPEQFKAAGLKKLSPDELQNLERFLKGYREQAVQESIKVTEERTNPAPKRDRATQRPVIEGTIQGHFAGLTGHTRMVLGDGSIWQQASDGDRFTANLDNPDVVIVKASIFGYKMYIQGAIRWFYVKQVVIH